MDRRAFGKQLSTLVLGAAVLESPAFGQSHTRNAGHSDVPAGQRPPLPFQLSVMLWTVFRNLPFEQRLQKIADAGYSNIELVGEFKTWKDEDFARANAKRKALGIAIDATAGLQHGISNPRERDAFLSEVKAILPVMEKLECPSLIVLSGNVIPGVSHADQHQSCIDCLKTTIPLVEGKTIDGRPVKLILENIDPVENPKYFLTSVAEGLEIIKAIDHPQVSFLYDLYHEQISEGNLIDKLVKNLKYVSIVHVADVPGRHEPGTGEINYTNILKKLVELKYDGMVAMEFLPTGDPLAALRA